MNDFSIYSKLKKSLPVRVQRSLGASKVLRPLRDHFFRPSGTEKTVEGAVNWEDLAFRLRASHSTLYRAQSRGVENRICRIARQILQKGDVAIDVGANYGFVTLVMCKSVGITGRVISIEADHIICEALRGTIAANGLGTAVKLVEKAASSRAGGRYVSVDAVVDDEMRERVRFVKIDIDGGDYDALIGARETLCTGHPVVVIEMTENQDLIYEFLRSAGYTHFIDMQEREVIPGRWPLNLIASVHPTNIPPPRSFGAGGR